MRVRRLASRGARGRRLGFTLVEMAVVISIIALMLAVAIPFFERSKRKNELRNTASRLVSHLTRARSLASTGKTDIPTWVAGDRAVMAGVRVISPTQYAIFVDNDGIPNGAPSEADIEVVDLADTGYDFQLLEPAGTEVRFRRNGTLTQAAGANLTLRDPASAEQRLIEVTFGGRARILL